ncbi:GTP-binding protein [[Haemophilus] felis]|uniref:GTP-binding protein n=1 Tax=[Haemophilus] felis TaxID=123822 RepID=A0A1T0B731_9PAST|nr:GTP-binding protein [[Haemophilus] felis]NBI40848.1 GTP-binding protein [[Haemophilus] felis]OOS05551.1 GTP-binding protein [[Haemophilus] felis]
MSNANSDQLLDSLLDKLPEEIRAPLKSKLDSAINYVPKIGVMGKSGAGKSSLINAILGKPVCETGSVGGCTRAFQEEHLHIGRHQITFMDLPGIAENENRHQEYSKLYAEKVQDLDLILWVIKVDDRANKNDEEFYNDLIKVYKKDRILFVLSQCDKAEPTRDWNYEKYCPSNKQLNVIKDNQNRLANDFNVPLNTVIPVACEFYDGKFDRYNVDLLVQVCVLSLPKEAKSSFYASVDKQNISFETKKEAQKGFIDYVSEALDVVIDYSSIPHHLKSIARKVKDVVVDGFKAVWNRWFG